MKGARIGLSSRSKSQTNCSPKSIEVLSNRSKSSFLHLSLPIPVFDHILWRRTLGVSFFLCVALQPLGISGSYGLRKAALVSQVLKHLAKARKRGIDFKMIFIKLSFFPIIDDSDQKNRATNFWEVDESLESPTL